MRDYLLTTPWVQNEVPLQEGDFVYYSYDGAEALADRYCNGGDLTQPDYIPKDTCRSIDDLYRTPLTEEAAVGAAQRLDQLVDSLIAADPLVQVDVLAHSQGGVVSAYWLQEYADPAHVNSVVTFDSPIGGLPDSFTWVAKRNCVVEQGVDPLTEAWHDAPEDLEDGSPANRALQDAPGKVDVFTMRTFTLDLVVPNKAGTFDGADCDSTGDFTPTRCGPGGRVIDLYATLGNHVALWDNPKPEALELIGCAVTGLVSQCVPDPAPIADADGDGVDNASDNCPVVPNWGQADVDLDGDGDACDPDDDADGVGDGSDNCQIVANPGQADSDSDGLGDDCDRDNDGDGMIDSVEDDYVCLDSAEADGLPDADADLLINLMEIIAGTDPCDPDSDGDDFEDGVEIFVGTDPLFKCGAGNWPPDFDDSKTVDILDVIQMTPPVFNSSPPDPNYSVRKDLNADGTINILDFVRIAPLFDSTCSLF